LFGSSYPSEIIDAVSGTLGVLRSATVIRLERGELWGWEGHHIGEGSCEGSCTHVLNYQQALAWLFPALERTLRETDFAYNQLPNGGLTFRQRLPLGSGFDIIGPCVDGHFGATIKAYREWRVSGDDAWLRRYWPNIRRSIEYAWSPDNPDRWDPDRTGVLWGEQHHTLDMELFGPNSWLTSFYIAALKAAAEMAEARGERDFVTECAHLARKGADYVDRELFNGRWYAQNLDLKDRSILEPFDRGREAGVLRDSFMQGYWSEEHGEIKYQIGGGCLTDQILGQWQAGLAGLGDLLSADHIDSALTAVYRENFRPIWASAAWPGLRAGRGGANQLPSRNITANTGEIKPRLLPLEGTALLPDAPLDQDEAYASPPIPPRINVRQGPRRPRSDLTRATVQTIALSDPPVLAR
jgi:non-lysosomal glucosylceramidase